MPAAVRREGLTTFERRRRALLEAIARTDPRDYTSGPDDYAQYALYFAQARFELDIDTEGGVAIVRSIERPNLFSRWADIDTYLRYGARYPASVVRVVRSRLGGDHAMEGRTANHKLMAWTTGYLVGQTWPEVAVESQTELCRERLLQVMREYVHVGMGAEYNSPTYQVFHVNAMLSLIDLADDPEMRRRARSVADWLLASTAAKWNDGYWIASTSRANKGVMGDPAGYQAGTAMAWLYFGGPTPVLPMGIHRHGEAAFAVLTAVSGYRPPGVIVRIATERARPFAHREAHLGAGGVWNRLTAYVHPDFGMASQCDGRSTEFELAATPQTPGERGPGHQMSRWFVRWKSEQPGSTLVMTHPRDEADEASRCAMYYKGRTRYEQVLQDDNVLVAVYDIPPDDPQPFIEGPFSTEAIRLRRERDGWIFCHGGTTLIALRIAKPYRWTGARELRDQFWCSDETRFGDRPGYRVDNLRSDAVKNALVVEVHAAGEFTSASEVDMPEMGRFEAQLARFAEAILAGTAVDLSRVDDEAPSLTYRSLAGRTLQITFDGDRVIEGRNVDHEAWPLLDSPFMSQATRSDHLELRLGGQVRRYDFGAWRVTDTE